MLTRPQEHEVGIKLPPQPFAVVLRGGQSGQIAKRLRVLQNRLKGKLPLVECCNRRFDLNCAAAVDAALGPVENRQL